MVGINAKLPGVLGEVQKKATEKEKKRVDAFAPPDTAVGKGNIATVMKPTNQRAADDPTNPVTKDPFKPVGKFPPEKPAAPAAQKAGGFGGASRRRKRYGRRDAGGDGGGPISQRGGRARTLLTEDDEDALGG